MSYEEFEQELYATVLPNKGKFIREGQALMNRLFEVRPDLYNHATVSSIDGPYVDCFYVDKVIPKTLEWLKTNWNADLGVPRTVTDAMHERAIANRR